MADYSQFDPFYNPKVQSVIEDLGQTGRGLRLNQGVAIGAGVGPVIPTDQGTPQIQQPQASPGQRQEKVRNLVGAYGGASANAMSDPYGNAYTNRSFQQGRDAAVAREGRIMGNDQLKADKQFLTEVFQETKGKSTDAWHMAWGEGDIADALEARTGIPTNGLSLKQYLSTPAVQGYVNQLKDNPEFAASQAERPQTAKEKQEIDAIRSQKGVPNRFEGVTNRINNERLDAFKQSTGREAKSMSELASFDKGLSSFEDKKLKLSLPKSDPFQKSEPIPDLQRADSEITKGYNVKSDKYDKYGADRMEIKDSSSNPNDIGPQKPGTMKMTGAYARYAGVATNAPAKTPEEFAKRAQKFEQHGQMQKAGINSNLVDPQLEETKKKQQKPYFADRTRGGMAA